VEVGRKNMKKIMSLVVIQQGKKVLLGLKKRGFGVGRWNGFGGKLVQGETVEESAIRETKEEAGIDLINLKKIGIMDFSYINGNDDKLEVHLFKSTKFSGKQTESDEMKPAWFDVNKIPFEKMWPSDKYWYPLFLQNKNFKANFVFDKPLSDRIIKYSIQEVNSL
jgi:8-oxo-dGTP pyrophosphatase MutT (NUDIX family)